MKKNIIAVAVAAAAIFSAANALANDGTVNFTGEILETACTVDLGTGSAISVDLGKVVKTAFTGVNGDAVARKTFTIKLKDCPAELQTAAVRFDGQAYNGDSSVLQLAAGGAQGVAIQLFDASDRKLALRTDSLSYALQPAPVVNELEFSAGYVQKEAVVTPGVADATATFAVIYN